ncbi:proteasome subunit beta type-3-like [Drosophila hydei]|uniref:Proteasome subunit beta n=1 Tax=Drosophila hydei TaxID=7224 RepID=A0A6J1MH67_DROHY|nr:proteasome subunit beta type-3-like [Drosophila hydei]
MSDNVMVSSGCVVAMRGKDCVAIGTDRRFSGPSYTAGDEFEKIFSISPRLYLGLTGLQTDILTVYHRLANRKNALEVSTNCVVTPKIAAELLSHMLYEHRFAPFYIEPVIAGMDPYTLEPFLCNMDLLGCFDEAPDFVVSGTCVEQLVGMCESLWNPNQTSRELFDAIAQVMVVACSRDAVSGCGARIYIIENEKVTVRLITTRMD